MVKSSLYQKLCPIIFYINSKGFEVLYVHKMNHHFNKNQLFLHKFLKFHPKPASEKNSFKIPYIPLFSLKTWLPIYKCQHTSKKTFARVFINECCSNRFFSAQSMFRLSGPQNDGLEGGSGGGESYYW